MNERDDKYDNLDEGEYHFSDENAAYEVDTETAKVGDVAVAKSPLFSNLNKSRRMLIALAVFFVLMFIVYKMLIPASPTPSITGDASTVNKPATAVAQAPKAAAPIPAQEAAPAPPTAAQSQQQASATASDQSMPVNMATTAEPQAGTPTDNNGSSLVAPSQPQDKLAVVEQQSAKLVADYQQKMTDYASQSAAAQTKLDELSTRVSNIEAALNQITQLLQSNAKPPSAPAPASSSTRAAKAIESKQMYTVQAIIPGRAWLKSDVGDTVTVAEGDILRDYGRVMKIDPYDGVVDIDTGNKVISLSYGASGD